MQSRPYEHTPNKFNAPLGKSSTKLSDYLIWTFSLSEFPSDMFVPSLLSAFHKHSQRQVLLAQTAAESSFQSCIEEVFGGN